MPNDKPTPIVCALLERIAEVLDADVGHVRAEFEFTDGRLRRWYLHAGPRGADDLARYDGRAAWLAADASAVRP